MIFIAVLVDAVATGYQLLSSVGTKFNAQFLCRLLDLFSKHHLYREFTKVILGSINALGPQLSSEHCMHIFRTMVECKMFSE